MKKLISSGLLISMILGSSIAIAADQGETNFTGDITLEKRVYQHDGFGAQWAFDVGSDGLWFVNKAPVSGSYDAPFKIDNNASANVLVVGSSESGKEGYVGIGTDAPQAQVDVAWSGSNTLGDGLTSMMTLTATNSEATKESDAGFVLKNGRTGKQWNFRTSDSGDSFSGTQQGTKGTEFKVYNDTGHVSGTKLYVGNGAKCENGVWINKSSRASKENIVTLNGKDALDTLRNLEPVKYNYKSDKTEQYVGFIAEDVPELVAINSRDGLSAMDMVAVLTKVVQEQDRMMKEQSERISKLEALQLK